MQFTARWHHTHAHAHTTTADRCTSCSCYRLSAYPTFYAHVRSYGYGGGNNQLAA